MNKAILLTAIIFTLFANTVSATLDYYYVTPANVDSSMLRNHTHIITFDGELNLTIPQNFTILSYNGTPNISDNNMFWNSSTTTTINAVTVLNGTCTQGGYWNELIYINNTLQDHFTLLCVNDSDIISLKFENGHGESAWMEDFFASPMSIYTLIRVFPHENYFHEKGMYANITCSVPDDLFISGKFNSTCSNSVCTLSKEWQELDTSLFRIFVFAQQIDYDTSQSYWVNCTDLTYTFMHEGITATLANASIESRTTTPFTFTAEQDVGDDLTRFTIENNESYAVYNLYATIKSPYTTNTEKVQKLEPGETYYFTTPIEDGTNISFIIDFLPSWEYNSLSPTSLRQSASIQSDYFYSGGTADSRTGFACVPRLVRITTNEPTQKIECTNYEPEDFDMLVTVGGDLANITTIINAPDNRFVLQAYGIKVITLQFDFDQMNYTGSVTMNSTTIALQQTTNYIVSPGIITLLTPLQGLTTSILQLQFVEAGETISGILSESAIALPRGGFIPRWMVCALAIAAIVPLLYWKRKDINKRYDKSGKTLYFLAAFLVFLVFMLCVFL